MHRFLLLLFLLVCLEGTGQVISTYVGNGTGGCFGFGGPAISSNILDPIGCTFDRNGNFYFANQMCHKICKVDNSGIITTIAGTGIAGFNGDGGLATAADLNYPNDLILDDLGNIYFADAQNYRIRKIDITTGVITTIAGKGIIGYGGDGGPATAALFNIPNGICFDKFKNLYISDCNNNRIRKIDNFGVITTYAGNGVAGFSGDNGPATSAQLYFPFDLVADTSGNIFFPDANNKRVRKINTGGIISTVAGTGITGYNGDEIPATTAEFHPYKIAIDSFGNIYLADSNRIRQVDTKGFIHTIAGVSTPGYNGDGIVATTARINSPSGIAIDGCGNVYFGDVSNHRIRKVTQPALYTKPTITITSPSTSKAGTTVTVTATVANAGSSYLIHWLNRGKEFATTTVPTVTYTKSAGIDTVTARVVSTATYGCYDSTTSAPHIIAVPSIVSMIGVEDIYLYPNPATGVLHIDNLQTTAEYRLLSMVGVVLQQGKVNEGSNVIDITALPVGMYLVEVSNAAVGLRMMYKIVKQ